MSQKLPQMLSSGGKTSLNLVRNSYKIMMKIVTKDTSLSKC